MSPSSSSLLNPRAHKILYPLPIFPSSASPRNFCSLQNVKFQRRLPSPRLAFQSSNELQVDELEEHVIGDCVVFEDGIFEDPVLQEDLTIDNSGLDNSKPKSKKNVPEIVSENLVPDRWREAQAEINITKNERRKIAHEIEFNSRVDKKKQGMIPLRHMNLEDSKAYKEAKLAQLKPLVLDNPSSLPVKEEVPVGKEVDLSNESASERVVPKNPRWAVYGRGLEDVSEIFSSENYDPSKKNTEGQGVVSYLRRRRRFYWVSGYQIWRLQLLRNGCLCTLLPHVENFTS